MIQTYASIHDVPRSDLADILDPEACDLSCGPGLDPTDVERIIDLHVNHGRSVDKHVILVDRRPAGIIDFRISTRRTAIGFVVHRDMRRRGVLSRAWADLAPRHGPLFHASCWADNGPARKALAGMGFHERHVDLSPRPIVLLDAVLNWSEDGVRHDMLSGMSRA